MEWTTGKKPANLICKKGSIALKCVMIYKQFGGENFLKLARGKKSFIFHLNIQLQ